MIRLSGLDLDYKTGCDCEFCKTNKRIYQYLVRKIFGRPYEHTSNKEQYLSDFNGMMKIKC